MRLEVLTEGFPRRRRLCWVGFGVLEGSSQARWVTWTKALTVYSWMFHLSFFILEWALEMKQLGIFIKQWSSTLISMMQRRIFIVLQTGWWNAGTLSCLMTPKGTRFITQQSKRRCVRAPKVFWILEQELEYLGLLELCFNYIYMYTNVN